MSPVPFLASFAIVCLTTSAMAQGNLSDPPAAPAEPKLQVKQIDGPLHALGDVRFDVEKRLITFPAAVNMDAGAIEFALVGTQGKVHEAVFSTDIRPMHLRAVLSLLNVEPSVKEKPAPNAADKEPKPAPKIAKQDWTKPGSPLEIHVSWDDDDKGGRQRISLRKSILVMEFEPVSAFDEKIILTPLPDGPWDYTGSRFDDYGFEAERELDFIGVERRLSALINLPHPKTHRDDLWQANGKALPKIGTAVEFEIKLPPKKES